jgi:hypothetical protein
MPLVGNLEGNSNWRARSMADRANCLAPIAILHFPHEKFGTGGCEGRVKRGSHVMRELPTRSVVYRWGDVDHANC